MVEGGGGYPSTTYNSLEFRNMANRLEGSYLGHRRV